MREEIREILENLAEKSFHDYTGKGSDLVDKALQAILEAVKKIVPEAMYDPRKVNQPEYPDDYTNGKVYGHNQCRTQILKELVNGQKEVKE